ncbi:MAG: hypothetical protein CSA22_05900 [Deltaproteobacteria bacterium]|nr:MAG: hypothetical protein CSA22_05900 [Deltaproteobacteria bacterium]
MRRRLQKDNAQQGESLLQIQLTRVPKTVRHPFQISVETLARSEKTDAGMDDRLVGWMLRTALTAEVPDTKGGRVTDAETDKRTQIASSIS